MHTIALMEKIYHLFPVFSPLIKEVSNSACRKVLEITMLCILSVGCMWMDAKKDRWVDDLQSQNAPPGETVLSVSLFLFSLIGAQGSFRWLAIQQSFEVGSEERV